MKVRISIWFVSLSLPSTLNCTALIAPCRNNPSHFTNLRVTSPSSTADDGTYYKVLAGNLANCLLCSDIKRMTGNDGASTGWTSWVDEKSCFRLQKCFDRLCFEKKEDISEQDKINRWMRWMKNSPTAMIIEISESLRTLVNETLDDRSLQVSFYNVLAIL
jgi:hypothetical protein